MTNKLKHTTLTRHERLSTWCKWRACDVEEAKEGLQNKLWRRWSNGRVGEWPVTLVKRRKSWRMSCDVGEVTERLENELCYDCNYELCSFSSLSVTSPMSQLILKPFRCFTYVTAYSPTLVSLLLRHRLFTYVTWGAAHDVVPISVVVI